MVQDEVNETINASILIIDDDIDHADLIHRCLDQIDTIRILVTHCKQLDEARRAVTPDGPDLILLDYQLQSENGLEFLRGLRAKGDHRPIVVLTSQGNENIAVEMMRAGADNYIVKADLEPGVLEQAIYPLLINSRDSKKARRHNQGVIKQLSTLTPREREVLDQIIRGKTNRQIAESLSRSENTIKIHRSRVMHKMHANTPADLVRMVLSANPSAATSAHNK